MSVFRNAGGVEWVEWDKVVFGVFFPIRVGFDRLCRWVEWGKVVLGGIWWTV